MTTSTSTGGAFNLNGIVATPDGKQLIAVQTAAKKLFVIDPRSGVTTAIDTGTYDLANGDGLLLKGRTLFVVQNRSNTIAVFRLSHDLTTATFVQAITDPDFDVPTSIDRCRSSISTSSTPASARPRRPIRTTTSSRSDRRPGGALRTGGACRPRGENDREPLCGALVSTVSSGGGGNRTRVHGRDRKGFSKLSLRSCLAASHHAGRCSAGQSVVGVPCGRHGPPGRRASLLLKDSLRGGPEGPPVT